MSSHAVRQKIYTQRRRAGRIIVSVEVDEQALIDALTAARLLSPLAARLDCIEGPEGARK